MSDPTKPVAAVCDNEVRIFGPAVPAKKGLVRRLWRIHFFPHHGAALLYAREHDERHNPALRESAEVLADKRRRRGAA